MNTVSEYVCNVVRFIRAIKNWYAVIPVFLHLRETIILKFRNGPCLYYDKGLFILETFLEQPYRVVNVKDRDVIDIGASNGDSAIYFSLRGAKHVYGFEPYPRSYRMALKNIYLNHVSNITLYNEGIAANESIVKIDPELPGTVGHVVKDFGEGIKVRMRTLSEIVSSLQLNDAILKMDCEGCEYEVLLSTDERTLRTFTEIVIEYHRESAPLLEKLLKIGFKARIVVEHKINGKQMPLIYAVRVD